MRMITRCPEIIKHRVLPSGGKRLHDAAVLSACPVREKTADRENARHSVFFPRCASNVVRHGARGKKTCGRACGNGMSIRSVLQRTAENV